MAMLIKTDPESRLAYAQNPDYVKAIAALSGCLLKQDANIFISNFMLHIVLELETYCRSYTEHFEQPFEDHVAYADEFFDENEIRFLDALTYIMEDGFDITGYELFEIPAEWIFVFTKEENGYFYEFDICVEPYPEKQVVEAYPCDIYDSCLRRQPSIKEAIFLVV